jgi:hypothetical protein
MKLIQYTTRPERADENEQLIRAVFAELSSRGEDGVRYAVLRLADGSFTHIVAADSGGSLTGLASFNAFQAKFGERVSVAPLVREAVLIGNHRLLGELE